MPLQVVNGALLQCAMAIPPGISSMVVMPIHWTNGESQPAANIMDYVPMANIQSFGMCMSPANPEVAAATAAALGVLTPMPCIPATTTPWTPGAIQATIDNFPALHQACTLMCMWGGVITVTEAGELTINVE